VKVLFLTQTTELGPASRYRVYQFLPALRAAGVAAEVSPAISSEDYRAYFGGSRLRKLRYLPGMIHRRRRDWRRFAEFDVVFIQKEVFPFWPGWRFPHPRVIYDFDDAVFGRATTRLWRTSRLVFAGNEYLADCARGAGARVEVVPTVVDTERFYPAAVPGRFVGWMGSRTTNKYLEELAPVLSGLPVRAVSAVRPAVPGEFLPWSLEREVELTRSFAIGLAPLADTAWERGKCGLKCLQYMACGVPVVGAPVGVQREFIEQSGGGLLARSLPEWREKIEWLLAHPAERAAMGARGREFVVAKFSLRTWAPRWLELVRGAS
jgi:glycosyltransferase involved in cell wall biosynthesis